MTLTEINIKSYFKERHKYAFSSTPLYFGCPEKFSVKINGVKDLSKFCDEIKVAIKDFKLPEDIRWNWFERDARISTQVTDKKTGTAGFVLLQEIMIVGGMSWREGVYGLKMKNKKANVELIHMNNGYYVNDYSKENEGSRLTVNSIDNGILKYTLMRRQENGGTRDLEFNLMNSL